jgi:hypothetical protein
MVLNHLLNPEDGWFESPPLHSSQMPLAMYTWQQVFVCFNFYGTNPYIIQFVRVISSYLVMKIVHKSLWNPK